MKVPENTDMASIDLDTNQVERSVDALLEYIKKKAKETLLDESQPINLQLGFKKVPREKNKIIKISLPHSLITPTSEVCLFVKDLDKKKRDFDPTERHFKELLEEKGVTCVNQVIPLKSLKTEYQPFEAKKNLSLMFDVFLADNRIIRLLPPFLGKNFYGRKRYPVQIDLTAKDLKGEFNKALDQSLCSISGKGSMSQVTVGATTQSKAQIVENVVAAIKKLEENILGGSANIRSLHIKSVDSPCLPVYISLASANDIELPARKRKRDFIEPEDVTPVIHGKVRVTPRGSISIVNAATAKTDEDKDFLVEAKKAKKLEKKKKRPAKEVKPNEAVEEEEKPVGKKKRRLSEGSDKITKNTPGKKGSKRKVTEDMEEVNVEGEVQKEVQSPKKKKSKVNTPKGKGAAQKDNVADNTESSPKTPSAKTPKTKTSEPKTPKAKTPQSKTPKSKTPKVKTVVENTEEQKTPKVKNTPKSAKKSKSISKVDTPNTKKSPKSAKKTPKSKQMTPKPS